LAEIGQQLPIVVVVSEASRFIVIAGYKRVRALKRLARDTLRATVWEIPEQRVPAFADTSHAHPARAVGGPKHPRLPPAAQCHGLVAKRDVVLYFRDAWSQPCSPLGLVPLRPRPDAASQNNLATTGFDRDAIRVYLCDPP
jgi:hypothetical protein